MTRAFGYSLLLFFSISSVYSCTSNRLTIKGLDVIGRTMELGGTNGFLPSFNSEIDGKLPWKIGVHPEGEELGLIGSILCTNGYSWKNKLSFLGVDFNFPISGQKRDYSITWEGMNTAGLTVSAQINLLASYAKSTEKDTAVLNIYFGDVVQWILGNFESVHDLRVTLKGQDVRIVNSNLVGQKQTRLHWAIDDAHGDHIVVECVDEEIRVLDNKVGIFTNDPFYEWHLRNLDNYMNLSPFWADAGGSDIQIDTTIGEVPVAISHGSNLLGIPGDYTPASRFVKQFYLRQFAVVNLKPVNVNDAIALMTALLNTVFIPKGILGNKERFNKSFEFTAFTVLKLPQDKLFYYKDYMNNQWRMIDLKRLNITSNIELPLAEKTMGIMDVTDKFNSDDTFDASNSCVDTGYNCIPTNPIIIPQNILWTLLPPFIVGLILGVCILTIKGRKREYHTLQGKKGKKDKL